MVKNKGLIAEAYEWDEEEVSSDDNERVEVKVLMALVKDNDFVSKEGVRNDEWVKISMRKFWAILLNHDTGRILPAESQRNTIDPSVAVTYSSSTSYGLVDESSVYSTPLPPLNKLHGVELVSVPKTIKLILTSKSTFKAKTLKGVIINESSSDPARGNKIYSASKVNAPTVVKHMVAQFIPQNDIEWFRRGEALQAKKDEALKSTKAESSNANRSKTPTKSGCLRYMTGVKSYLHKYVEHSRPKVVFRDDSTCTTEGYGSIKCNGIVFTKFDEKRGTIFNSNKEVVMISPRDKHIELINIIGDPRAGMLTQVMAKELGAASSHECLFVDFLSKEEPKKVSKALQHPGWVDALQDELNRNKGEIGITTFKNALRAHYLPHLSEYVSPPSLVVVRPWFATISFFHFHSESTSGCDASVDFIAKADLRNLLLMIPYLYNMKDELEQQKAKAKAKVASLKARPLNLNINQLIKVLTIQWELSTEFLVLPNQISSLQEKAKDKGVPLAGKSNASLTEGAKNTYPATKEPNLKNDFVDLMGIDMREVVQACPERKEKGWKTIYGLIKTIMEYLNQTEKELKIDFNKPLKEQDPLNELNDLANKKRKRADDLKDHSMSTKKHKSSVQYEKEILYSNKLVLYDLENQTIRWIDYNFNEIKETSGSSAFVRVSLEGNIVATRIDTTLHFYGDPYLTTGEILLGTMDRPKAVEPLYAALEDP
nr:Ysc84 actin-binding domain-containing protein [Tanacetum cinerariifolium]